MGDSLFDPQVFGWNYVGVHSQINESINKVDYDQRKELINNIVLTGGNSTIQNFNERLQKEFWKYLAPASKTKIYSNIDPSVANWLGGAILSSLGSFQPMWISRGEYDECGPSIISRKNL